jgi:hypothetical protein
VGYLLVGGSEGALMRNLYDVFPLWSTKQGRMDAERLHAQQREASLTGERDAALARVAELEATVTGLQARLTDAEQGKAFYMALFQDAQKGA